MVAQVLSFRGRQFIFSMFNDQSGFASVHGKNARGNATTRNKGIAAGTKHTSVIKVRANEVSAYLDGELLSSYTTDYSDLDVAKAWNIGPNATKASFLGLAVECPVTVDTITLTTVQGEGTSTPPGAVVSTTPKQSPAVAAYRELAAMISGPYSVDSAAAPASQPVFSPGALQPLVAASQPVVSDVAASLTQPAAVPNADALFRAVQVSMTPATALADPLLDSQPAERSSAGVDRAEFDAEQVRLSAWRTLIGRMSDFYPDAKPKSGLVKVQLASADASNPGKGKPASFVLTNANSEPLTNATVAVEAVHAITNPSPTAARYYFIRRWAPGQKIYLPSVWVPNVASPELLASAGPAEPSGLGGLVEARVQVWSDKLTQASQPTKFDANLQAIGRAQLERAYAMVDEALRRPSPSAAASSKPAAAGGGDDPGPAGANARSSALIVGPVVANRVDLNDDSPELAPARALARNASGLPSSQSSFAEDAKNLAEHPLAALRDLRKRQVDAFVNALAAKSSRQGVYVAHKPGLVAKMTKSADREAAISAAGGATGRLTLTVDSRANDGTAVAVTLNSADQPELKRKFSGRLQLDASANRLLLNLRATQPPPSKPPTEADLKRVIYWSSLLLELKGNNLIGIGTAGPSDATTILNVAFDAPSAAPPPPSPAPKKPPPARPK